MIIKKLIGARLIVRPEMTKDYTDSGIILPGSLQERTQEGEIVMVGEGHALAKGGRYACCAKVGDRVFYGRMAGVEVFLGKEDDDKCLIITDEDIVAIIKKEEKDVADSIA